MRFFRFLLASVAVFLSNSTGFVNGIHGETCEMDKSVSTANNCIQFSVTSGTGCAWMCNYCANQLATNNYYFTDGVCTYQEGQGCVGNPIAGKTYSCCSV
jgi:hypothetical protein